MPLSLNSAIAARAEGGCGEALGDVYDEGSLFSGAS